jgi:hypothetical protein
LGGRSVKYIARIFMPMRDRGATVGSGIEVDLRHEQT